jgi:hypothetical protein
VDNDQDETTDCDDDSWRNATVCVDVDDNSTSDPVNGAKGKTEVDPIENVKLEWNPGYLLNYKYMGATGQYWTDWDIQKRPGGLIRMTAQGCDPLEDSERWNLYLECPGISETELPSFKGRQLYSGDEADRACAKEILQLVNQAGEKYCKPGPAKSSFDGWILYATSRSSPSADTGPIRVHR